MWGELAASPRGQGVLMFVLADPAKDRAPAGKPGLATLISPSGWGHQERSGKGNSPQRSSVPRRSGQIAPATSGHGSGPQRP